MVFSSFIVVESSSYNKKITAQILVNIVQSRLLYCV